MLWIWSAKPTAIAITLAVIVLAALEPGYTMEPKKWTTKTPRYPMNVAKGIIQKGIDPIFFWLSESEKEQVGELWKSVLKSPTIMKLEKQNHEHTSLLEFEKISWEVFDYDVLQKTPNPRSIPNTPRTANREKVAEAVNGVLKQLVIDFKLFKKHLQDRDPECREAARKDLVDLAGEKAVDQMETWLRTRKTFAQPTK